MDEKKVKVLAENALKFLKLKNTAVHIFIINEKAMKLLNRRFLGKRTATNVLSFEEPKGFPAAEGKVCLGEVYLCPSYIKRKREDIRFMAFHGILHLLGYNHETKGDRMKMRELETKFLAWLENKS